MVDSFGFLGLDRNRISRRRRGTARTPYSAVIARESGRSSTPRPHRFNRYRLRILNRPVKPTMTAVVRMVLEKIPLAKDVRLMSTATDRSTR
jgi:hypothetical protein